MVRNSAIIAAVLVLGGCATQAQQQFNSITTNIRSAGMSFQECMTAAYESDDAAVLRPRMPLQAKDATLQQVTETAVVSDREIAAIYLTQPKMQACKNTMVNQVSLSMPSMVPMLLAELTAEENRLIALTQRRITWGQYVRESKEASAELRVRMTAEAQRIQGQLERANNVELAQRAQAFDSALAAYQRQEVINSLNRR